MRVVFSLFWALPGGVLLLTSCSLLTSLDGFDNGRASAAPDDAAYDARLTSDGGADAAGASEGGVHASFCASLAAPAPFLCADFDDGMPLAPRFGLLLQGTTVSVNAIDSVSSPASLAFDFPKDADGLRGALEAALPSTFRRVVVELDLRLEARGAAKAHDFIGFMSTIPDRELSLEVNPDDGTLHLDEDVPPTIGPHVDTGLSATLPDRWVHIRWDAVLGGAQATNTFTIDGAVVGTVTSSREPFIASVLHIGDRTSQRLSAPWRTRMDNLVVRIE